MNSTLAPKSLKNNQKTSASAAIIPITQIAGVGSLSLICIPISASEKRMVTYRVLLCVRSLFLQRFEGKRFVDVLIQQFPQFLKREHHGDTVASCMSDF